MKQLFLLLHILLVTTSLYPALKSFTIPASTPEYMLPRLKHEFLTTGICQCPVLIRTIQYVKNMQDLRDLCDYLYINRLLPRSLCTSDHTILLLKQARDIGNQLAAFYFCYPRDQARYSLILQTLSLTLAQQPNQSCTQLQQKLTFLHVAAALSLSITYQTSQYLHLRRELKKFDLATMQRLQEYQYTLEQRIRQAATRMETDKNHPQPKDVAPSE